MCDEFEVNYKLCLKKTITTQLFYMEIRVHPLFKESMARNSLL